MGGPVFAGLPPSDADANLMFDSGTGLLMALCGSVLLVACGRCALRLYTRGMGTLCDTIVATVAGWGAEPDQALHLEQRIFGSTDPLRIAQCIEAFCTNVLGAAVVDCLFWRSNMGSVSGVHLADGRRAVIKAYPSTAAQGSLHFFTDLAHLTAVHRVQRFLVERGFPCPSPVLGPMPTEHGYALVEEMVASGAQVDAHDPAIRRVMAEALVRLVTLARALGPMPDLAPRHARGTVRPTPHHAMFNFDATAAGAERIDELARAAQPALARDPSPFVVGHMDWRTEHFRFVEGTVGAIYDSAVVGVAAVTFTATWDIPVLVSPTPRRQAPSSPNMRLRAGCASHSPSMRRSAPRLRTLVRMVPVPSMPWTPLLPASRPLVSVRDCSFIAK